MKIKRKGSSTEQESEESSEQNCPDCGYEVWYCTTEHRHFHKDVDKECFLTHGKDQGGES